jgi:hypothetical protein
MQLTTDAYDTHCRKPGCTCQHIDCHRGWRDTEPTAAKQETSPCERCRPDTHRRWLDREAARIKGYPGEALERIMRGTSK